MMTGLFAGKNEFGIRTRMTEQARIDEIIIDNHIGALDTFQAAHRDQPRIARPGPDQINFA